MRLEGRFTKSSNFLRIMLSVAAMIAFIAMLGPMIMQTFRDYRSAGNFKSFLTADTDGLIALGMILIFLFASIISIYVFVVNTKRNNQPALIVDEIGVTYLPWSSSPIKWEEISDIEMKYFWNGKWGTYLFEIFIKDKKEDTAERSLTKIGNLFSNRPLIRIEELNIDQEQLIEAIAKNSQFRVKDIAKEEQ